MISSTRKRLLWELRWIPIELSMIGFGLFLQLRLELVEAAAFLLLLAVAISGVVRWRHYSSQ